MKNRLSQICQCLLFETFKSTLWKNTEPWCKNRNGRVLYFGRHLDEERNHFPEYFMLCVTKEIANLKHCSVFFSITNIAGVIQNVLECVYLHMTACFMDVEGDYGTCLICIWSSLMVSEKMKSAWDNCDDNDNVWNGQFMRKCLSFGRSVDLKKFD